MSLLARAISGLTPFMTLILMINRLIGDKMKTTQHPSQQAGTRRRTAPPSWVRLRLAGILASFTLGISAFGQSCVAPPGGLVGWWPGDGNFLDMAGTNNGTPMGGLGFAPGMVGQAFNGDGTKSFLDLGNSPAFNLPQFTVETWAFIEPSALWNRNVVLMGKGSGWSCDGGFFLGCASSMEGVWSVGFPVYAGCSVLSNPYFASGDRAAGFYYLAGTFDGHVARLYTNGILAATGGWISGIGLNSFPIRIGASSAFEKYGEYDRFPGRIDEASLYNRALTDSEIAALYAAGSAGKCRGLGQLDSPRQVGQLLAGDSLWLSGHGSLLSDNQPAQLRWDFGNGRSSPLSVPGLVSFSTLGTNTVTLTVLDRAGASAGVVATRNIIVVPDTNSIPDLAVSQLNVPGNLAIGQPVTVSYVVRNAGDGTLSGQSWHDTLYLSRDGRLDVNDRLLDSTVVSEVMAPGGNYTNTITFTLPLVGEGAYYLLLSANDEWNFLERHRLNNEFPVPTGVAIPQLTNAVPSSGTFAGNGDEHYYRIDVTAGQNLLIQLHGLDGLGASEVYVRFGALPTRGAFDYSAAAPGSADQQVLVPVAMPGTYYPEFHLKNTH